MCPHCDKPENLCVCDRTQVQHVRIRVIVLQHPQEQDVALGSARVAALNLEGAEIVVGLSWASLAAVAGKGADPHRWAVVYPGKATEAPSDGSIAMLVDKRGQRVPAKAIEGVIVLDGTWSQAKALWWRNPWLLKLNRLMLWPREPSIYGALRREPRKVYLSTLESIAEALDALGESPEVREHLRRVFRTMVQRARDAQKGPAPERQRR